jgi:hypothetical protein
MLAKPKEAAPTITFRSHSWVVRLIAAGITAKMLAVALDASGGPSSAAPVVIAFLLALGFSIPVALLVWDQRRGVHVGTDGVRAVSANGSAFVSWAEIAGFEISPYRAGTFAVYAVRQDGSRVALGDTARWPYQRAAVERVRDQLVGYRERRS